MHTSKELEPPEQPSAGPSSMKRGKNHTRCKQSMASVEAPWYHASQATSVQIEINVP
jgi:hypothetical protein